MFAQGQSAKKSQTQQETGKITLQTDIPGFVDTGTGKDFFHEDGSKGDDDKCRHPSSSLSDY
jgi:hypothetical protein